MTENTGQLGSSGVVLRYFNCRGRGQALRYLLVDQGIDFVDERFEAGQSWAIRKATTHAGGPFGSLPVLTWGNDSIGQTLAIANYISRNLGHDQGREPSDLARLDSVLSSAYLDLTCVVRELLRPRIMPSSDQWKAFFDEFIHTIPSRLSAFDRQLTEEYPFFGGAQPIAADYFVFEAIDVWSDLLGAPFLVSLAACPRLTTLCASLTARPRLKAYLASGCRPPLLTASPYEREIRERLSATVAKQALLG